MGLEQGRTFFTHIGHDDNNNYRHNTQLSEAATIFIQIKVLMRQLALHLPF